jgi:hypothetical protein
MANPSPTCEVKDGSGAYQATTSGVDVTVGNTITIRLSSQTDVDSWLIECATTDDTSDADTVTAALSIDSTNKTATFTAPAAGKAYRFRSRVNGGIDRNGVVRASYETTFCVYTLVSGRRVLAVDETTEGDATFGWSKWYNDMIRSLPAGAGLSWSSGSGGSPAGVTGAMQVNGGSGTFKGASGTVWDAVTGILSVGSGTRLNQPFAHGAVLGGTTIYTGTDVFANGLAQHKPWSAVRQVTHQGGMATACGFTCMLPNKSINTIVVEANAVPSGHGLAPGGVGPNIAIAGGSYVRRRTVFVNSVGGATSTAMELTSSNEFTSSGLGFTGYAIGTGLALSHTGSSFVVGMNGNPTGVVLWGLTVTVQTTTLA